MAGEATVLLFGEDPTDCRALAHLLKALVPETSFSTKPIRDPVILQRSANPEKKRSMSRTVAKMANVLGEKGKIIVVAHRDCDAVEPAHVVEGEDLKRSLQREGVKHPVAATPAWEMETWWLLFPEAFQSIQGCWRHLNLGGRDVGLIENSKQELIRALRPVLASDRKRCRDYSESDGVDIAQFIRESGLAKHDDRLKSASLRKLKEEFEEALKAQA